MIAALLAPKFLVLYTFIITGAYVHFRGKVRHKFWRQLLDHSTIMAPYNCFVYATSAVPNKPYVGLDNFPDLQPLQDNWQTIRQEALGLFVLRGVYGLWEVNDYGSIRVHQDIGIT